MATRSKNPGLNRGNPGLNPENRVKFCQVCSKKHSGSINELCMLAKPDKVAKFTRSDNRKDSLGSKTKASHFDVSDDESFFNNSFTSILESSKRNYSKKSPSGDREFPEFQQFNETARSRQTMPSPKKRKKSQERVQPSSGFIREDENPDHMKRFSIPHEKTECTSTGLSNEQFSFFNDMINQKIHQSIQDNLMIEPCKNKNALNDQKTVHKNKHLPSTSLKINDDDLREYHSFGFIFDKLDLIVIIITHHILLSITFYYYT